MSFKHQFGFVAATLLCGAHIVQIAVAQGATGWIPFKVLPIEQGPMMTRPNGTYEQISPQGTLPLVYRRRQVSVQNGERKESFDEITITSQFINQSQAMLNSAADLLKKEGFRAPALEKLNGAYIGRIHPGTFACDEETGCNLADETYGVYRSYAKKGGETSESGKLFLSDSWKEAKTAVVPHELFHSVVAAYPKFGIKQQADEKCSTACWIDEGMAEGFAKYWSDKYGSAHGFAKNTGYVRSRTYDEPLATGRGEEDYDTGVATGRFWRFVAQVAGSYKPMHTVLESSVSARNNNGVNVVDAAFRSSMKKSLGDLYGEFVRLELKANSKSDYGSNGTYKLDPEIKEKDSFRVRSLPFLASYPMKVEIKADQLEWPTLKIIRQGTGDPKTRVYWGTREIKGELKIPTKSLTRVGNKEDNRYELWLKVANTNIDGPVKEDGATVQFEWSQDKCALLPANGIKRMIYKMDSPSVETTTTYSFGSHKKVGDETHFPATTTFQSREKSGKFNAKGQSKATWKCTSSGVVMDGMITGAALNIRVNEKATAETVSNTVYYPSTVKSGQTLPGGAVSLRISAAGATALLFNTNYSSRRVVGQQTLVIPGIGKTKCWVIESDISYGASAGKGMQNMIEARLKKMPFYQTPEGKKMLADPAFRRSVLGATNSMVGAFAAQAGGKHKVWFKRGLGLVRTETTDKKTGKISSTMLQSVVYG